MKLHIEFKNIDFAESIASVLFPNWLEDDLEAEKWEQWLEIYTDCCEYVQMEFDTETMSAKLVPYK